MVYKNRKVRNRTHVAHAPSVDSAQPVQFSQSLHCLLEQDMNPGVSKGHAANIGQTA